MTLRELIAMIETTCVDNSTTMEQLMDREICFDTNKGQFVADDSTMYVSAFDEEDYINVSLVSE